MHFADQEATDDSRSHHRTDSRSDEVFPVSAAQSGIAIRLETLAKAPASRLQFDIASVIGQLTDVVARGQGANIGRSDVDIGPLACCLILQVLAISDAGQRDVK